MNDEPSGKEFDATQVDPLAFFIDGKTHHKRGFDDDTQKEFEMLQAIMRFANCEWISRQFLKYLLESARYRIESPRGNSTAAKLDNVILDLP